MSVDLLVEDLVADLEGRAFELAKVAGGCMFRTRSAYAPAIRAAADVSDQLLDLSEFDIAVLAWNLKARCDRFRYLSFISTSLNASVGVRHPRGLVARVILVSPRLR